MCAVFDQLCHGVGWDEEAQSWCSIICHDPSEPVPAALRGGRPLEWGKLSRVFFYANFTRSNWSGSQVVNLPVYLLFRPNECVCFPGGYPDHHGLDAWWFWLHVGFWWSGVGSFYVHLASVLPGPPSQRPEPASSHSHRHTQMWGRAWNWIHSPSSYVFNILLSHSGVCVLSLCISVIGFYIFRKSNSEKNAFRRNPSNPKLSRKFSCGLIPN